MSLTMKNLVDPLIDEIHETRRRIAGAALDMTRIEFQRTPDGDNWRKVDPFGNPSHITEAASLNPKSPN